MAPAGIARRGHYEMSLTTIFRDAFDAIKTAHPELTVAVIIGGVVGTGTRDTSTDAVNLTDSGETGISSGRVRVSAGDFSKPARGDVITVNGLACFSGDVQTDAVGAFYIIPYQVQKPVTGTGNIV